MRSEGYTIILCDVGYARSEGWDVCELGCKTIGASEGSQCKWNNYSQG